MVVGVHDRAAHGGPPAHMALTAGFADLDIAVVGVSHLTDRGFALLADIAHLTGGEAHLNHAALFGHKLSGNARGTDELGAVAGGKLHVVDQFADGNS
ncbi:hypothetical protein SDC9_115333 [bioreactor metagenome]|uniref:Uncharacterized protein n=1 Tax=bioreactor metagenome TaxID=1076179 RepID=A0A645BUV1_9ZZZZ